MIRHRLRIYQAWIAEYVCDYVTLPVLYDVAQDDTPSPYGDITWKDQS